METTERFPPRPEGVPADLTVPTPAYRLHAWTAFSALLIFVGLYFGLTGWLGWVAWKLVSDAWGSSDFFFAAMLATPAVFLVVFLVKGLFFVRHGDDPGQLEITEAEEPELFAFVNRVADEAGAPRPHRIFLSSRVNAAVFYDLSLLNLLLPSKKNLEIGLGLVNVLTLDEFKAVMAHEFGHFAQRTMAVGRWVYIAHQIVADVVGNRGMLDSFLSGLNRFDLRVAWIGWILSLMVWAIRAWVETGFRAIMLAQRALSREMEYQADLVSVSVSGSDSLIHGLHRLGPADDAWGRALGFTHSELVRERPVEDFFALQEHIQARMGRVLNDADYGRPPKIPEDPGAHRVFTEAMAQPPQMWSTHPSNRDREENAKRVYVRSVLDERSAWELFADPSARKQSMTRQMLQMMAGDDLEVGEPIPLDQTLAAVDLQFDRAHLNPRYQGLYYSRSAFSGAPSVDDLYGSLVGEPEELLGGIYTDRVHEDLQALRELDEERGALQGLKDGVLTAPGGMIKYRGQDVPRQRLPELIGEVERERAEAIDGVLAHDRRCRTAHRVAADKLGQGWPEYHASLLALGHYLDHAQSEIGDLSDYLRFVVAYVTADGNVSASELRRLVSTASDVKIALKQVWDARGEVSLPPTVLELLEVEDWPSMLEDNEELAWPDQENVGPWLGVIDSWIGATLGPLDRASQATLQALLEAEQHLSDCIVSGEDPGPAPEGATAPNEYVTRCPGTEREREKQLAMWDRFVLADGWVPGTARFAAAAAILLPPLWVTMQVGEATVAVVNGLNTPVEIEIAGEVLTLPPKGLAELGVVADGVEVVARTADGREIERFEADATNTWGTYVYNVAGGAPLVEWTASYGSAREVDPTPLGNQRWVLSRADVVFDDPPESVSTRGGGSTRTVITELSGEPVQVQVGEAADGAEAMILAHARFDELDSDGQTWLTVAWSRGLADQILPERIAANPDEVALRRLEQEAATQKGTLSEVCEDHRARSAAAPESADWAYLAARCQDEPAQSQAFEAALAAHPGHDWLSVAVAYVRARQGDWATAERMLAAHSARGDVPDYGVELARLRQLLGRPDALDSSSEVVVQFAKMIEAGALPPGLEAYRHVYRGELDEALAEARTQDSDMLHHILALVAASDGAKPAHLAALAQAPLGDGESSAIFFTHAAAVALTGGDVTPFVEVLPGHCEREAVEAVAALLDVEAVRAEPGLVDKAAALANPLTRARIRLMGRMILGDAAPAHWSAEARGLLLAPERPYIEP